MAPIMLGGSAVFFWIATKVHTHNALYCFAQLCEGGGKLFYYWNRIVFVTLYSSIWMFSSIMALQQWTTMAIVFAVVMTLVTFFFDRAVSSSFVTNSLHLPISIARIHDQEEVALLSDARIQSDGGENFVYRHPILNQENWSRKPTWK